MVIKVQVLDVKTSNSKDINYGLVVEQINKKFFNRGRINPVFDAELLAEMIIPHETILKYTTAAIRGSENIPVDIDGERKEITYHYVFLSEWVLGIEQLKDEASDGDA